MGDQRTTRLDVKARKAYVSPSDYWAMKDAVCKTTAADDPLANVKALRLVFSQADVDQLMEEPHEPVAVIVVA